MSEGMEEKIARLEKEFGLWGSDTERKLLDLRADADRVRIELAAIKNFLRAEIPSFEKEFPRILERAIEEINPEFE